MSDILTSDLFSSPIAPPETVLWLAVIERAMLDAIYPTIEMSVRHRHSLSYFFSETKPKPYNLEYICSNLFDYPDGANVIRKRLAYLKRQAEQQNKFVRAKRYKGYY